MFKETIAYTDYNGVERTEDFYFNLSKGEIAKMQLAHSGNLADWMKSVIEAKDQQKIVDLFNEIVDMSYGVKSEDGRRFIKTPQVLEEFKQTEAYSDFYFKLVTDAGYASKFVNAIIPADIQAQAASQSAKLAS